MVEQKMRRVDPLDPFVSEKEKPGQCESEQFEFWVTASPWGEARTSQARTASDRTSLKPSQVQG